MKISYVAARSHRSAVLALCAYMLAGCTGLGDFLDPTATPRADHGHADGGATVLFVLQTDPDGAADIFSFAHTFEDHTNPAFPVVPSPFTLTDGDVKMFAGVGAGTYTITPESLEGWELVATGADEETTGCFGAGSVDMSTGVVTVAVENGAFVSCTVVYRKDESGGEEPPPDEEEPPPDNGEPPLITTNPRTVGQWRNWSSCSNGSQYNAALANDEERLTLDFYLPDHEDVFPIGAIASMNCEQASNILSRRDLNGGTHGRDPAYTLAAQLLTARLNKEAGAPFPSCAAQAAGAAQELLIALSGTDGVSSWTGFTGLGDYLGPKPKNSLRSAAQRLAELLARYNAEDTAVMSNDCS